LRSIPASRDRTKLVRKKTAARLAVALVSTLEVPRLVMNPPPPPMPRPPPSERWRSTIPIMATTTMRWMTMMTVCIGEIRPRKGGASGGLGLHISNRLAIPMAAAIRISKRSVNSRAYLHDPARLFHASPLTWINDEWFQT
jgi:hypothetical protein